jgi:hypothetical protein
MFRHCTAQPRFMRLAPPLKLTRHTFLSSGVRPKAMRSSSSASKLSASAADAGARSAIALNVAVADAMYSDCSFEYSKPPCVGWSGGTWHDECCKTRKSVMLDGIVSAPDATVATESKTEQPSATFSATNASSGLNVAAGNLKETEGLIFLAVGDEGDGDVADKADCEDVKGE